MSGIAVCRVFMIQLAVHVIGQQDAHAVEKEGQCFDPIRAVPDQSRIVEGDFFRGLLLLVLWGLFVAAILCRVATLDARIPKFADAREEKLRARYPIRPPGLSSRGRCQLLHAPARTLRRQT